MKLLHTSDWHLGAKLGRQDRLPDQITALRALIDAAEHHSPDLILHTGDLFDASRPPYEALEVGVRVLVRLARIAPTVVLSGNHDSPLLLRVIDHLAAATEPRRLRFVTRPEVVEFDELDGRAVAVACVPFIPPSAIAHYATDDPSRFEGTYTDGVRALNDQLLTRAEAVAGQRGVVLYAAHLHVHGARPGKSERRITVGEDYATHISELHRALYAAFGHIHDPQLLPGGTVQGRYAGSLIPIDFGEVTQQKEAVLVRIEHEVTAESIPLPPGRPLAEFRGSLDELAARAANGGLNGTILKARVVSDEPILDLADQLAGWSPECDVFEIVNDLTHRQFEAIDLQAEPEAEPPLEDLFLEWRRSAARGVQASDEAALEAFRELLGGAGVGKPSDLGVAALHKRAEEALGALRTSGEGVD